VINHFKVERPAMPSPIAHVAVGYLIKEAYQRSQQTQPNRSMFRRFAILFVFVTLSLLPDLDAVLGILFGNFGRYHNNASHSLIVGLFVALIIGSVAWWRKRFGFVMWFSFALLCYEMHVIMDFFTVGRGVMLFWPLTSERFISPVLLFYGLHWSDGWISIKHVWTLVSELGFMIFVVGILYLFQNKKEIFPKKLSFFRPFWR
jgi:inner membrane protein